MNTTTAATQAGVTVATIRTWCRTGVIAAAKRAGKWVIDTTSLAYRINLPALLRKTRRAAALTIEALTAIGGRLWEKNGMRRVYFNSWGQFAGLDISRYQSGGVNGASLDGRSIANGRVSAILASIDKIWFDVTDGEFYAYENGATEFSIRYLDGDRDTVDLFALAVAGIRAAVAAL